MRGKSPSSARLVAALLGRGRGSRVQGIAAQPQPPACTALCSGSMAPAVLGWLWAPCSSPCAPFGAGPPPPPFPSACLGVAPWWCPACSSALCRATVVPTLDKEARTWRQELLKDAVCESGWLNVKLSHLRTTLLFNPNHLHSCKAKPASNPQFLLFNARAGVC